MQFWHLWRLIHEGEREARAIDFFMWECLLRCEKEFRAFYVGKTRRETFPALDLRFPAAKLAVFKELWYDLACAQTGVFWNLHKIRKTPFSPHTKYQVRNMNRVFGTWHVLRGEFSGIYVKSGKLLFPRIPSTKFATWTGYLVFGMCSEESFPEFT